jgi:hypothetical protein
MPLSVSALIAGVYIGAQGLLLAGAHTDIAGTQHGTALGAILQAGVASKRVSARIEGIPPVSLPQKPSAFYGQATPELSLINGAVRFAVDSGAHFWAGAGETVINQRTPLPNLSQVVTSRLAGIRYEMMYRLPLGGARFFEATIGAAPHLTGSDHYAYSVPHPAVDKPEVAAEEDAMLAYGVNLPDAQLLFGLRTIGFSARYAATGAAGDRNNGGGIVVEYRRFFGSFPR